MVQPGDDRAEGGNSSVSRIRVTNSSRSPDWRMAPQNPPHSGNPMSVSGR
jgi:hypothetical protein